MGSVDLTYQQASAAQEDPNGDVFAPAPDMSTITQGTPAMNPYGMLPVVHWEQWWSLSDTTFAELASATAPILFSQEQQFPHSISALNTETATQWDSFSNSINSYPAFSPQTDATSLRVSTGNSRRGSSTTQPDHRRRDRSAAAKPKSQPSATNTTKRASTRRYSKTDPDTNSASKNPNRARRSKASAKLPPRSERKEEDDEDEHDNSEGDPKQDHATPTKQVQQRNRIASNKFRIKKREDAIKLRIDEEDMEQANHNLTSCVSDLTMQIYDLKMKLLQHTDCDCVLIKDYIATEAKRFVKDLGEGKYPNATPPLPPQPPSQQIHHQYHV